MTAFRSVQFDFIVIHFDLKGIHLDLSFVCAEYAAASIEADSFCLGKSTWSVLKENGTQTITGRYLL